MNNFFNTLRKFFAPPAFEGDEEKTRAAELMNTVLNSIIVLTILISSALAILAHAPLGQALASLSVIPFMLIFKIAIQRGYVRAVSILTVGFLTINMSILMPINGTMRTTSITLYILTSIIAGLTLGRQAAYWTTGVNSLIVFGIALAETNGLLPPVATESTLQQWLVFAVMSIMTVILLNQALRRIQASLELAKARQEELSQLNIGLEQRVADRTKALAASAEVSRRLSRAVDLNELAGEIVNQIRDSFGYYHVQTYQVDEASGDLILSRGTGEAGEKMLAKGHRVPRGAGLVGRAAERGEPVLVSDTSQDPDWLPNPLLPDTKSELAIPIMFETGVGGVFDVQHNVVNGLGQEDIDALVGVANQIAIASLNIISSQTVAKRAAELQTVARVSTAAATLQDVDEMLTTVVHLTQREFDLYHAHVFVLNEEAQDLEIVACGWQAGDEHEGTHGTTVISLEQEQSLVARAARTRQPVIVNDVRNEPGWLPNPQLPETRAEMAVPLVVGDQVLGVMDVQASREGAFSDEDAAIHMTLASQVGTALQNARSFVNAQKQAEREATLNIIAQKIQNTGTIEEAMQIAARELGRALGKRQTFVALDPKVLSEGSRAEVTTEAAE